MDGTLILEQGSLYDLLYLCTANASALTRHPVQRARRWLDRVWKYFSSTIRFIGHERMSRTTTIFPTRCSINF